MNGLTTIRNAIKTRLATLTIGNGYTFTLASVPSTVDDPLQVAESLFPRAYVWTPAGEDIQITDDDVSANVNAWAAPVLVDVWRKMLPGQDISDLADATAADVIKCIATSSTWNGDAGAPSLKTVAYNYIGDIPDILMVRLRYECNVAFSVAAP